jgi:phosphoribosylformylglycinamidine synthase
MAKPRVLILRAPGANCDLETQHAFHRAGAAADRVHINRVLESPRSLENFQILCIPGGFSYGDDVAAGRILATHITLHLSDVLRDFRSRERLIVGICNGFQVLIRTGLLLDQEPVLAGAGQTSLHESLGGDVHTALSAKQRPGLGSSSSPALATLTWNDSGHLEDRWVHLCIEPGNCVFLQNMQRMFVPVAHAEG